MCVSGHKSKKQQINKYLYGTWVQPDFPSTGKWNIIQSRKVKKERDIEGPYIEKKANYTVCESSLIPPRGGSRNF